MKLRKLQNSFTYHVLVKLSYNSFVVVDVVLAFH